MRRVDLHVPADSIVDRLTMPDRELVGAATLRSIEVVARNTSSTTAVLSFDKPVADALASSELVTDWETIEHSDEEHRYVCSVEDGALFDQVGADVETLVHVEAVTVEDDGWTVCLIGPSAAFSCPDQPSALLRRLSILRTATYRGPQSPLDALTERQREILEAAYDAGYFEIPRESTASVIANRFDLDRSTVTEHLQRAERVIISTLLDR